MRVLKFLAIAAAAATLAGCLGGGGGTAAAPELRGTAAIGAPLAGATVTLRGANETELIVTAGPDGRFVFPDTSSVTAPAMLRAEGTAGGRSHTLFSVASTLPAAGGSAVANVTPLTHEVLTLALDAEPTLQTSPTTAQLNNLNLALTRLSEALVDVFEALGLLANTNPLTTPFAADGRGLDQLLDLISFEADVNADNIAISDKSTGTTASLALAGTVPPVAVPSATGLDTSGIATLVANFNRLIASPNDRLALFHTSFLHDGMADRAAANNQLATSRVAEVAIDGCRVENTVATCTINGRLSFTNADIPSIPFSIDVRRVGTEWQLFGNQSDRPVLPVVIPPTTVAEDSGRFNWTTPAAPTNAVTDNTRNGNMAFRFIGHDGHTQTVQAAVGSTLLHSVTAFAPLIDNDLLIVNTSRVGFLGQDWGLSTTYLTTPPSVARKISLLPDGLVNAMFGCAGPSLEDGAVFLSHNLRPVTLEHAMANGLGGQVFDLINCRAEKIGVSGGHQEWLRVNANGSLSYGFSFNSTETSVHEQTAPEFVQMLSPEGFADRDSGGAWHDRAQIYELVIGDYRMFFILWHAIEWDVNDVPTSNPPTRTYVNLLIPR